MIAPPKPPPLDDLEALIKEARERQLRRRLLGVAVVAIAAAVGLSVYAFVADGKLDRIAQKPANAGRASGPICRSSQLSASAFWNGAAGTVINAMTLVNRSGSTCSLPLGRPAVQISWHGALLRTREQAASSGDFPGRRIDRLSPGSKAIVYMQWWNWCGSPNASAITTVILHFGRQLRVEARHVYGQPPCLSPAAPSRISVSRPLTAD
jgi:Protein of unknown function (DUF4232)